MCGFADSHRSNRSTSRTTDRITIRLWPGDGLAVMQRAAERGFKPATYISALVRAHITANPPLPSAEVNVLKMSLGVLAGLGTVLADTSRHGIPSGPQAELYREAIQRTRGEIAALEQRIVDLTKAKRHQAHACWRTATRMPAAFEYLAPLAIAAAAVAVAVTSF